LAEQVRGLSRSFELTLLRRGLGNFSSDFRLEFFLGKHRLLLHFDQGLLETFPVVGNRSASLATAPASAKESPAGQGNEHNQSRHYQPRRHLFFHP